MKDGKWVTFFKSTYTRKKKREKSKRQGFDIHRARGIGFPAIRVESKGDADFIVVFSMLRFHLPLIKPDVRNYRIRLSDRAHAVAHGKLCVNDVRRTRPACR